MQGMRITVIGGSGFIGRTLIQKLAKKGAIIRAGVRSVHSARFLRPMGEIGQVTPEYAHVTKPETLNVLCHNADVVINLVGILFEKGKNTFDAIHAVGAQNVAQAALNANVPQFIHVSALGADESSASKYARSKAKGEQNVKGLIPAANIIRPSVVFGPHDDFFNRFAQLASVSPALPLFGGGENKMQPVYVGDVVDSILKLIENPHIQGQTYELGGPRQYTFRELMELTLHHINQQRCLLSLPYGVGTMIGTVGQILPTPPITPDQIKLLKKDNIVTGSLPGLNDLGIPPTSVESILPTYLSQYEKAF